MIVVELIYNLAILVAISVFSGFIRKRKIESPLIANILQGALFGTAAIIGMLRPFVLTEGIIFDGRSIVISLCTLFFGPVAGLISALPALIYRVLIIGGGGAVMGSLVISSSFLIGYAFHYFYYKKNPQDSLTNLRLLLFGIIVHVFMMGFMFTLPSPSMLKAMELLAITVLGAYPLVTMLIGKILKDQEDNEFYIRQITSAEKLFRTTLYSIGDAVITTDRRGVVKQMNPIAEILTGWSEPEAHGKQLSEVFKIVDETTRQIMDNPVFRVVNEGKVVGLANHTMLLSKSGREFPIADSGAPIKDESNQIIGVVIVFRDQTEERRKQRDLLESERKYRLVAENTGDVIWSFDPNAQRYEYMSPAIIRLRGYTPDEVNELPIEKQLTPESYKKFLDTVPGRITGINDGTITERSFLDELDQVRKSGEIIHTEIVTNYMIDDAGKVSRIVGATRDVTERKRAQKQIQLLSKAISESPVSVVITDQSGIVQYVNPKYTQFTGFAAEEVIGKPARYLESTEHPKEFFDELWQAIQSGNEWKGEIINRKKNGEKYWENVTVSPITDAAGVITHFVAVKEDISAMKNMIDDLRKAKESAEEMNRIKSSFFANMSHELRTPLVGILGYSSVLQESLGEMNKLAQMAKTIHLSGSRLLTTLNKILTISKLDSEKIIPQVRADDLSKILREVYNLYQPLAQNKGISMSIRLPKQECMIETDTKILLEVLNNLVNNAINYTEVGEISLYLMAENGHVQIIVSDTGIGIPGDKAAVIWEDFRQASEGYNRSFEGTGLGLSIVKRYVQLLNGSITLKSTPGIGSSFTITLPVSWKNQNTEILPAADLQSNKKAITMDTHKQYNLLYVEDDTIAQNYVRMILPKNFLIDFALSGEEAVRMSLAKRFDGILMDINLKRGMDGIETMKTIRSNPDYESVPFLALTAYAMKSDEEVMLASGFNVYLSKPFAGEDLKMAVNRLFAYPTEE